MNIQSNNLASNKYSPRSVICFECSINRFEYQILKVFECANKLKSYYGDSIQISYDEMHLKLIGDNETINKVKHHLTNLKLDLKKSIIKYNALIVESIQNNIVEYENYLDENGVKCIISLNDDKLIIHFLEDFMAYKCYNAINILIGYKTVFLNKFDISRIELGFHNLNQLKYNYSKNDMIIHCDNSTSDTFNQYFRDTTVYSKSFNLFKNGLLTKKNLEYLKHFEFNSPNKLSSLLSGLKINQENNKYQVSINATYNTELTIMQYMKKKLDKVYTDFVKIKKFQTNAVGNFNFQKKIQDIAINNKCFANFNNDSSSTDLFKFHNISIEINALNETIIKSIDTAVGYLKEENIGLNKLSQNLLDLKKEAKNFILDLVDAEKYSLDYLKAIIFAQFKKANKFNSILVSLPILDDFKIIDDNQIVEIFVKILLENIATTETKIERIIFIDLNLKNEIIGLFKMNLHSHVNINEKIYFNLKNSLPLTELIESKIHDLFDVKCDAIVCPTFGSIGATVHKKGGDLLRRDIEKNAYFTMPNGNVFLTSRGNFYTFKFIIHCLMPDEHEFEYKFKDLIKKILGEAEKNRFETIAFPALCMGSRAISREAIPKLFLDAICEYLSANETNLKKIYFAFNNFSNYTIFIDYFKIFNELSYCNFVRVTFHPIGCQDLNTDVIINPTGYFFSQDSNTSQQLLLDGGFEINKELNNKFNQSDVILFTTGGLLKCKKILHVDMSGILMDVNSALLKALLEINNNRYKSVNITIQFQEMMFPIIATINKFFRDYNSTINEIKICTNLDKKILMSLFSSPQLIINKKIKINSNEIELISNNENNLQISKELITKFISDQIIQQEIKHNFINPDLNEFTKQNIEIDCINNYVHTQWCLNDSSLILSGEESNVIKSVLVALNNFDENDNKSKLNIPFSWNLSRTLDLVDINSNSNEYKDVLNTIIKSGFYNFSQVIKLQRIQNKHLYLQYQTMKQIFHEKYSSYEYEKTLFHGTRDECVNSIFRKGFNRAYAGYNATVYGKGVYFAKSADLSHKYTSKSLIGEHSMFICKVLVGRFELGNPKMLTTNDGFDTTVDNIMYPSIYSIFHDSQAYPEYLFIYK